MRSWIDPEVASSHWFHLVYCWNTTLRTRWFCSEEAMMMLLSCPQHGTGFPSIILQHIRAFLWLDLIKSKQTECLHIQTCMPAKYKLLSTYWHRLLKSNTEMTTVMEFILMEFIFLYFMCCSLAIFPETDQGKKFTFTRLLISISQQLSNFQPLVFQ